MKTLLALTAVLCFSQVFGYGAGQMVSVVSKERNVCQDCLNFFTDLQDIVKNANTTTQIENLLNQMVCSELSDALQGLCKDMVKMEVPKLLQKLASMEDPNQVCGVIGMCSQKILLMGLKPQPQRQRRLKDETCDLCKDVVNEMKDVIRNQQTEEDLENIIKTDLCPIIQPFFNNCKEAVDQYGSMVFDLIVNELDPVVVCQMLKMCTQKQEIALSRIGLSSSLTKVKVFTPKPKVKDSADCEMCKTIVGVVEGLLANNKTEEEIMAELLEVCSFLPKTLTDQCTELVTEYGRTVINYLINGMTPDTVCTALNLCQQAPGVKGPSFTCVVCEFVISKLDDLIGQNKSEANVEAALEKVCSLLPETVSEECKSFVELYGPTVINLLVNELSPGVVCKALGICTDQKTTKVSMPVSVKKTSDTPLCDICKEVMQQLDGILENNATEAQIEDALEKVCSLLPSTYKEQCDNLIEEYGPAIIELLVQELDPQEICSSLGLCSASVTMKKGPVKGEVCELCVTVANYLINIAKENVTDQDLEMLLEKFCNKLSDPFKTQCDDVVEQYVPLLLELLATYSDPRQMCQEIGMCNYTRKAEKQDNKLRFKPSLLGQDKCTFGPGFWCLSKENAVRCGMVEHCERHVWSKKRVLN